MSVLIKDYCKANTNDFAKRLLKLRDKNVIIDSDELGFLDDYVKTMVKICIAHAITCNDVEIIRLVFGDCYWFFNTSFEDYGYELWINLKDDML